MGLDYLLSKVYEKSISFMGNEAQYVSLEDTLELVSRAFIEGINFHVKQVKDEKGKNRTNISDSNA